MSLQFGPVLERGSIFCEMLLRDGALCSGLSRLQRAFTSLEE